MATSFPLYDLIFSVTPESARIESTSWAKVRRGMSSEPAKAMVGTTVTRRPATSHRSPRVMRLKLGQRRKVFRDLRAIREHSRQQSGQGAQENHAGQSSGLERVDEKRLPDQTARAKQRPGKVCNDMSADDPGDSAHGCERGGLHQDDAENGRAPRPQRAHRGNLASALDCGAVH